jgi:hypothetical protein
MNFFEQELRKIINSCTGINNPVFAGRTCFCDLGEGNKAKLQFVELGYKNHYEALQATILNRAEGKLDAVLFRFEDIWGRKANITNHNGIPHIWTYNGESDWYMYHPVDSEYKQLAASVSAYLDVFTVRNRVPETTKEQAASKESVVKKLRDSKQNPAPRKSRTPKNHGER